jgi:hypothetical protein
VVEQVVVCRRQRLTASSCLTCRTRVTELEVELSRRFITVTTRECIAKSMSAIQAPVDIGAEGFCYIGVYSKFGRNSFDEIMTRITRIGNYLHLFLCTFFDDQLQLEVQPEASSTYYCSVNWT